MAGPEEKISAENAEKRSTEEQYFSVDIEASGRTPGTSSLISIGTCLTLDPENRDYHFYEELEPLPNAGYLLEAMRVASKGLLCLKGIDIIHEPAYDPSSDLFDPEAVLGMLHMWGGSPREIMKMYAGYIEEKREGKTPVFLASPDGFDWMFPASYFEMFYEERNPFGFRPQDPGQWYKGLKRDLHADMWELVGGKKELTHNALEDAIAQAKVYQKIFEMIP